MKGFNMSNENEKKEISFFPTGNKVVIVLEREKEKTAGGIIIPNVAKVKPIVARVVAVGPGRINEYGNLIPVNCKVGDRIMFSKMVGLPFKYNGDEYMAIPDSDIVCIIAEDAEVEASSLF